MLQNLLTYSLLAFGVHCITAANTISTSVDTSETCITRYRHGHSPSPIHTSTRTTCETIWQATVLEQQPQTATQTILPNPTTVVEESATIVTIDADSIVNGSTTTIYTTVIAGNANESAGCSSTNTVQVAATTTVFTGTYDPPEQTPAAGLVARSKPPPNSVVFHMFGQRPFVARHRNPFEVDCLIKETTYLISISTPPAGHTVTQKTTAPTPTAWISSLRALTAPKSFAVNGTVTITSTILAPSSPSLCTTTITTATSSTTQALQCAPTNLISALNGTGIGGTQSDESVDEGLAPGGDPSACCQLCLDTANCAASADDLSAGNCFLFYTKDPVCGLGFTYVSGTELEPGEGFYLQRGCGTIESGVVAVET